MNYICPMHPEVVSEKPGFCPDCGMNLVKHKAKNKEGDGVHDEHERHKGHSTNIFKTKFWVSLVLTIPVVLYSEVVGMLLKWHPPEFAGSEYLTFVLASIIFFYGGSIFLVSAWREVRGRMPGMMTLVSLAILSAYAWSVYATFAGRGETLYWELATLITIMLLGHWLEMRAVQGAKGALRELSKLLPDTAEVIRGGETVKVSLSELKEGDCVLVRPGGKVPADGLVEDGASEIDESLATGESKPVPKEKDSEVIAGTVNGDGALTVRVTKIGEHTFLAGVQRLVAEAEASKSRLQMLSDRAALYLTGIAVVFGFGALILWLMVGAETSFAVERLVAVLVVACPHALGLAIPLVASISTTKAAKNGFLVKRRLALESARNIDTVLFDKTGTLTKGEFGIVQIWTVDRRDESEVLRLAASLDTLSEHPIAKAVAAEAKRRGLPLFEAKQFEALRGKGAKAMVEGKEVYVGGPALLEAKAIALPPSLRDAVQGAGGHTIIFVVEEGRVLGAIALEDIIREESRDAVKALQAMGARVAMVTGDSEDVAKWVAEELGIDQYFARVLPQDKVEKVKLLQSEGQKVAMVGDGINDAPALTQADLGIAVGAGTNVAIESAGIILMRNDPRDIPKIVRLSKMTYRKMVQNLFWAAGYNIVAMPLAAGALAAWGVMLQPAVAAALMSVSTVIVAVNAVLLRRAPLVSG